MASGSGFGRKSKSSDYFARGIAAQKLAIDSLRNIANVNVSDAGSESVGPDSDPEVAAIIGVLRGAGSPLAIADVAERLRWDSDKAAQALARGGETGIFVFAKDGDRTTVTLTDP